MARANPRLAAVLVGDVVRQPSARVKYGLFFEAVGRCVPLVDIFDATLRGVPRYLNALHVASLNRHKWKERFYQNVPAFVARSKKTAAHLRMLVGRAELVLQEGVLFDAAWGGASLPHIIYTDHTAMLASLRRDAGRSPFDERARAEWIALEIQGFQRAAHICTRSRWVREAIIRDAGIAPDRVTAIGGGVNFAALPPLPEKRDGARPTVLFIGKDFYRKGGDLLLRAFARVREPVRDARLLMLTAGPIPSDLPRAGVELMRPTWDREEIEALYRQADILVLPSRLETWGDVLLEAMAYGLPCIGVAGQAMEEMIQDGTTGIIVPPEDDAALSQAIQALLARPRLARQYGIAARARTAKEFTWDHVSQRLARVIDQVWQDHGR